MDSAARNCLHLARVSCPTPRSSNRSATCCPPPRNNPIRSERALFLTRSFRRAPTHSRPSPRVQLALRWASLRLCGREGFRGRARYGHKRAQGWGRCHCLSEAAPANKTFEALTLQGKHCRLRARARQSGTCALRQPIMIDNYDKSGAGPQQVRSPGAGRPAAPPARFTSPGSGALAGIYCAERAKFRPSYSTAAPTGHWPGTPTGGQLRSAQVRRRSIDRTVDAQRPLIDRPLCYLSSQVNDFHLSSVGRVRASARRRPDEPRDLGQLYYWS